MKAFARWLYMLTHRRELIAVKMYAKRNVRGLPPADGLVECGKAQGACATLEILDLLA